MESIKARVLSQLDSFYEIPIVNNLINVMVKIGLFDYLQKQTEPKSAEEIKKALSLQIPTRNLFDLLDLLYSHEHLKRENELFEARYSNNHSYFVKDYKENYLHVLANIDVSLSNHKNLTNLLKKGISSDCKELFDLLEFDSAQAEIFYKEMGTFQENKFEILTKNFDLANYSTILDIGGCSGNLMAKLKKKYGTRLDCTVFDLPNVKPYFEEFMKSENLENSIKFISGNMFIDSFPKSDVIVLGNILHDWSLEKKVFLLKKVNESLNSSGIVLVIESFVDDKRTNKERLLLSFKMLIECNGGYDMTRLELMTLARETDFKKTDFLDELGGVDIAVLYK